MAKRKMGVPTLSTKLEAKETDAKTIVTRPISRNMIRRKPTHRKKRCAFGVSGSLGGEVFPHIEYEANPGDNTSVSLRASGESLIPEGKHHFRWVGNKGDIAPNDPNTEAPSVSTSDIAFSIDVRKDGAGEENGWSTRPP